jgi:hypothetical protein
MVATVEGSDLVQPVSSAAASSRKTNNRFISHPSFLMNCIFILPQDVDNLNKEQFMISLRKV